MHKIKLVLPREITGAWINVSDSCGRALVAGGCLRDTYFGVPYKDIDIFVSPDFNADRLAKKMGSDWIVEEMWGPNSSTKAMDYEDAFGIQMPSIWEMREGDLPPVIQIMVWPSTPQPDVLLGYFDFGFSQIAYDGSETVATDAFLADAEGNTATFMQGEDYWRLDRCHHRAERIGQRHPGRRWIWPPGAEPPVFTVPNDEDPIKS